MQRASSRVSVHFALSQSRRTMNFRFSASSWNETMLSGEGWSSTSSIFSKATILILLWLVSKRIWPSRHETSSTRVWPCDELGRTLCVLWLPSLILTHSLHLQCNFCGKTFLNGQYLLAHLERRHAEHRPFNIPSNTTRKPKLDESKDKDHQQNVCLYVFSLNNTYVCMVVCTYVRMYGCMYVCMYVCMVVCIYVCMYVCMYGCMYVCM